MNRKCRPGSSDINNAKYSYDVSGNHMALHLKKSGLCSPHSQRNEPGAIYIDQGLQEFSYRLNTSGGWQAANAPRLGLELNAPMLVLEESNHIGQLPKVYSGLKVLNRMYLPQPSSARGWSRLCCGVYESPWPSGSLLFSGIRVYSLGE